MSKTVTYRTMHKEYLDLVQDPIDSVILFGQVLKDFFEEVHGLIIKENYFFKLPFRLGYLRISKNKLSTGMYEKRKVNFYKTKELNTVVRFTNKHTSGYYFFFDWIKNVAYCKFINRYYYTFKAVRDEQSNQIGTRGLNRWIMKCADDPYTKDYDAPMKVSSNGL